MKIYCVWCGEEVTIDELASTDLTAPTCVECAWGSGRQPEEDEEEKAG